jgi:hypothetical protein
MSHDSLPTPPRLLHRRSVVLTLSVIGTILACSLLYGQRVKEYLSGIVWPEVKVVDPGAPGAHPADAIVLFDGKSMSEWVEGDDWPVKDGYVTTAKHDIHTKREFGDCQLHVEWAAPEEVTGSGQGRGNSGVYIMSRYELQVLDSYDNTTYPDGQAGAVYKQQPPLVNVCRKPGEWQTYDIVFSAPRFDDQGNVVKPAFITALQNGVLIQNHFQLQGGTSFTEPPKYTAHPPKMPLLLQYHNNKVRFRNIWIREL